MSLWTDKVVAEAVRGKVQGGAWTASRVEIDSRSVKSGDLFFALKGERFDGHNFVDSAFDRMASAAVVSQKMPPDKKCVVVDDTLKALQALGNYARHRAQGKIIGITGSVGKTSAKEMMRLALAAHGDVFASYGNYNNHIGVPLNLANLPPQAPYAVFEMGMNHKGEIAELTRMVQPYIAVITGVDAVHLEFFGSVEAIADAKAEIFEGVVADGVAILNADSPHFDRLKAAAQKKKIRRIIGCGESQLADCRLVDYRPNMSGCTVHAMIFGKRVTYTLKAVGRHWALLSLFTLAATQALGLSVEASASALATFSEPKGRGRVEKIPLRGGEFLLIDDSYNASPTSMRAAFVKTAEVWEAAGKKGRKIALLGDMLELGKDAPLLHANLGVTLERQGFSMVLTAGKWMESLYEALPQTIRSGHAEQPRALLPALMQSLRPGDVLLIKGSHGSKIYELVDDIKSEAAHTAREQRYAV